jgi:drug/metabolite transporter (DMT)-like permease
MSAYFVPLVTLALAVVVLGERPAPLQLLGGLVILGGVRLAAGGTRRLEIVETARVA